MTVERFILKGSQTATGGPGNDVFIIANEMITSNASIVISEATLNTIQLISGLEISNSRVAFSITTNDYDLELTLRNNARIIILSSEDYTYEIGGNPMIKQTGSQLNYDTFATNILGISNIRPPRGSFSSGGAVTI